MDEREYGEYPEEYELEEEYSADADVWKEAEVLAGNDHEEEPGDSSDLDIDIPYSDRDFTDEFYDAEDGEAEHFEINDEEDGYEETEDEEAFEKQYTVSTQGFYEQYGDEIRASVREIDEEEIYSEYEVSEDELEEGEYQFPSKKRKKKHYLLKLLIIAVVAGTVIAVGMSPLFNIKTIKVEGDHSHKDEQIIKASGVKKGMNIFKVSESDVCEALQKDAYFSSVTISRKLPGQLTIKVAERTESAYIKYGHSNVVIDSKGYVLRKTDKKIKLTELCDIKIKSMETGEKLEVDEEDTFKKTLEILDSMKSDDIFFKRIVVKKVMFRAYIKNNLLCRGKADNIIKNMKNGNLASVLEDLYKKGKHKGTITLGDDNYCSYSPKVL